MAVTEHGSMAGARFVDPKILARIGNLELLARTVVDGFINGLHRAPFFGASIDFAEHRGYVAGDDIRRVDWRLYARTDRYYVKQYEADTNTNFTILLRHLEVDELRERAASSKLEYGCYLGACLAYLAHRQRDRVGIITFDERHRHARAAVGEALQRGAAHARPREGRAARPPGAPLNKMAEHFKRRGILAADLGFLRRARRDPRGDQAAPLPRQRPDRLPRARSRRRSTSLRRRVELRGPRERRADAGRARVVPRAVPRS